MDPLPRAAVLPVAVVVGDGLPVGQVAGRHSPDAAVVRHAQQGVDDLPPVVDAPLLPDQRLDQAPRRLRQIARVRLPRRLRGLPGAHEANPPTSLLLSPLRLPSNFRQTVSYRHLWSRNVRSGYRLELDAMVAGKRLLMGMRTGPDLKRDLIRERRTRSKAGAMPAEGADRAETGNSKAAVEDAAHQANRSRE